jgi:hypothetical protein
LTVILCPALSCCWCCCSKKLASTVPLYVEARRKRVDPNQEVREGDTEQPPAAVKVAAADPQVTCVCPNLYAASLLNDLQERYRNSCLPRLLVTDLHVASLLRHSIMYSRLVFCSVPRAVALDMFMCRTLRRMAQVAFPTHPL